MPKGWGKRAILVLDEVIVEKAFAKRLPWAGSLYSFAKKRKVWGIQIIVLVWCSLEGQWRIPVGFRLWRPKRSCRAQRYQTKLELAAELVTAVVAAKLPVSYIVGDTHYTAGWFTKKLARLGLTWHGTLDPKTIVIWRGKRQSVHKLAVSLKLKWRPQLGLRARALRVFAPKYGHLRLVVTRSRHGNYEYLVSNDLSLDLTTMVQRKRCRWSVETVFRDTKQFAGLAACQCWVDQAMVRHVALVFLTFVVLQLLRTSPHESLVAVKERWQLAVLRGDDRGQGHFLGVTEKTIGRFRIGPIFTRLVNVGRRLWDDMWRQPTSIPEERFLPMSILPPLALSVIFQYWSLILSLVSSYTYEMLLQRYLRHWLVQLKSLLDLTPLEQACADYHRQSGRGQPVRHTVSRLIRAVLPPSPQLNPHMWG